jgi:hypothetical protein
LRNQDKELMVPALERNRALRDRDAHSEGGTNKFRDFDALLRDLTGGIEITMPSACSTESPSPLAIAQKIFLGTLSLGERVPLRRSRE